MGKKWSWLSCLGRFFCVASKDKSFNVADKRNVKEKRNHGQSTSFFPLHRKPSSIEKILQDAERENKKLQVLPPNRIHGSRPSIPIAPFGFSRNLRHVSAIKIQAAYKGYMARKNYRTLKGLMRLQGMMRGQQVERQTMNAMRYMQLLVKVQSQIRSRRIQMMENKSLWQKTPCISEKDLESSYSMWSFTHQSEADRQEDWDDSALTKEERDARNRRRLEAVLKRERALAYAYSRQLLNTTPKSIHSAMMDTKSGGAPMWWNWVERKLPDYHNLENQIVAAEPSINTSTEQRSRLMMVSEERLARPISQGRQRTVFAGSTPTSAKQQTRNRLHMRDDESLTSCPAFAATPRYMVPTASARAKVRSHALPSPGKKRFSFGLAESIGSMKWGAQKDSRKARVVVGRHRSMNSIGSMSVDSVVSLPVGFGRTRFEYLS